jgi:hypothetical protein
MPDLDNVDKDLNHLYPEFRETLKAILQQAATECHQFGVVDWYVVETHRSVERQLWLYGQGRKGVSGVKYARSGDQVTWDRIPRKHGFGLAADLCPRRRNAKGVLELWWKAPMTVWKQLQHVAHLHNCITGLDWKGKASGDTGHVQFKDELNSEMKPKAAAFLDSIGLSHPPLSV